MLTTDTVERSLLDAATARYRADGFEVFIEPSPAILPPFMQDNRPDAIAIGPGKKIAIEVARSGGAAGERVKRLQERFVQHQDWELVVLYVSPGASAERLETASRDDINRAVQEVIDLRSIGRQMAALVMGWSALEAIARALLPNQLSRPQPPAKLLETLASRGYLTPSETDTLRAAARLRNAAAHGQLNTAVALEELDALISTLQTLIGFLPKQAA
jgi:uncharacterized protein YutE (UPF0331/DUF86 family)